MDKKILILAIVVILVVAFAMRKAPEETPSTSSVPSTPTIPETPSTPNVPDAPDTPSTPTIPETPPVPDTSYSLNSGDYDFTLEHGGLTREYHAHVPSSYDKTPTALVLALHGGGSTWDNIRDSSQYNPKSDEEGFIVVYPQGTGKVTLGQLSGSWNSGSSGGGYAYDNMINDVGFISKMLDELEENFNIDEKSVYSTGISMGGMMSYRLACELSDRIAAIAPISSALVTDPCNPSNPVSVMHFHGTEDRFVPFDGGPSDSTLLKSLIVGGPYPSTDDSISAFLENNGCGGSSTTSYQSGDVSCESYSSCDKGSEVVFCTVEGGGHTWPGAAPQTGNFMKDTLGETTQDISATDAAWDFFQKHAR